MVTWLRISPGLIGFYCLLNGMQMYHNRLIGKEDFGLLIGMSVCMLLVNIVLLLAFPVEKD